jgi:hypothetical protein
VEVGPTLTCVCAHVDVLSSSCADCHISFADWVVIDGQLPPELSAKSYCADYSQMVNLHKDDGGINAWQR